MKRLPLAALATALAVTSPQGSVAHASVSVARTVYNITVTPSGVAYFFQNDGARTGLPACAAGFTNRWSFSITTQAGQALLATVLTAYAANKPIIVAGNNTCDVAGDTESVSYLYIADH